MALLSLSITTLVLLVASTFAEAAGLDCKPLDPRQQVDEGTALDLKGSAQTLFRIGKMEGDLKRETKKEVKNLYDKYPNADKVVLNDKLIYFFCTYLDHADDLSSDQKFQKLLIFMKEIRGIPEPPPPPAPHEPGGKGENTNPPPPRCASTISGTWQSNDGSIVTIYQVGNDVTAKTVNALVLYGVSDVYEFKGKISDCRIASSYIEVVNGVPTSQGMAQGSISEDGRQITGQFTNTTTGISGVWFLQKID